MAKTVRFFEYVNVELKYNVFQADPINQGFEI